MRGTRRHRYIDFHVDYSDLNTDGTHSELLQALRTHALALFSKNLKDLRLWVVQFDGTQGILKCHYTEKDHVIQLLLSIKKIGTKPVMISTRSTSGTIRGLAEKKQKNIQE
ncbi:MAG TPA: Rpp14/Pop5 family protein [Candidatus Thermoplasmatota archaeon]|nr:Rpp14/Pop5 family protein [Candidatus Thermoplasmatota archaeon]